MIYQYPFLCDKIHDFFQEKRFISEYLLCLMTAFSIKVFATFFNAKLSNWIWPKMNFPPLFARKLYLFFKQAGFILTKIYRKERCSSNAASLQIRSIFSTEISQFTIARIHF